ncbi:ABC transporter permease subunit [Vaginisenegalia massiliensis]|uniref:ABC transporter permease subunit n=1 Tax=Vaginisenegalia massiliensis TaxID=2058294 RepID=UPI000F52BE00|nr:ABC transporter permease subunit [Vaginisenegalia massiliensis]
MLNAIRADFYRLIRSRGFIINQILLFSILILTIVTKATGSIGVKVSDSNLPQTNPLDHLQWTSPVSAQAASGIASFLIYFGLPLFIIIVGHDLTKKTYKNILTNGLSRWQYFLSKFGVFLFMLLLQFIFYYGCIMITAGVRTGFGQLDQVFWAKLASTIAFQYLNLLAIFSIAMLILYLFFSNVGAVIASVVIPIVMSITYLIYKNELISHFNFQPNIDSAWGLKFASPTYLQSCLACVAVILICNSLSYLIFKKKAL